MSARKLFTTQKIVLIFCIVGALLYGNSLFNDFVGDDFAQVRDNPPVHSILKIPSLFSQGNFHDESNIQKSNYYKPLLSTTFSLIYFFSRENPFGFHLIQILIHITNSILIYLIFSYFFKKKISFLLTLLFLTHPLNTEAVVYISSLQDPLFSLFGLLAIYLSLKNHLNSYAITTLLLLSLLSKETGVLFLLIIPFFNYLYKKEKFFKSLVQSFLTLLIYVFFRFAIAHVYFRQNPIVPIMAFPSWERAMSIPKIIFFYLKTFFYPKDLLIFQSWTVKSFNILDFYLPLILCSILFSAAIIFGIIVFRRSIKLFKILLFFFFWFSIGLGIHLQIIPLDQTVSDRWFYLPMVGLLGMIGVTIKYLNHIKNLKFGIIVPVVFVIITIFSIRVIVRNTNWKNESTLYTHDIKYNQDSCQLERGLGHVFLAQGKIDEAEIHYIEATNLFPSMNSFSSLGLFYFSNNRFEGAKNSFSSALNYDSDYYPIRIYLAISKYKLGDVEGALIDARKAYSISQSKLILGVLEAIENGQEINIR